MPMNPFAVDMTLAVLNALAGITAVAFLGGTVKRRFGERLGVILLGSFLGLISVMQLLTPIPVAPGVFIDLRNLPVAFAAAFYSVEGTLASVVLPVAIRLLIGGAGAFAGVVGILIATAAGMIWRVSMRKREVVRTWDLVGLGLLLSTSMLAFALLPPAVRPVLVESAAPIFLALYVASIVVAGSLMVARRRREADLCVMADAALCDAETGLFNELGLARHLDEHRRHQMVPDSQGAIVVHLKDLHWVTEIHGASVRRAMLNGIGKEISQHLRGVDIAARTAEDRLSIFLPGLSEDEVSDLALLLERALNQPLILPDFGPLKIRSSHVSAWLPRTMDPGDVIDEAHAAAKTDREPGSARTGVSVKCTGTLFETTERMMEKGRQKKAG